MFPIGIFQFLLSGDVLMLVCLGERGLGPGLLTQGGREIGPGLFTQETISRLEVRLSLLLLLEHPGGRVLGLDCLGFLNLLHLLLLLEHPGGRVLGLGRLRFLNLFVLLFLELPGGRVPSLGRLRFRDLI